MQLMIWLRNLIVDLTIILLLACTTHANSGGRVKSNTGAVEHRNYANSQIWVHRDQIENTIPGGLVLFSIPQFNSMNGFAKLTFQYGHLRHGPIACVWPQNASDSGCRKVSFHYAFFSTTDVAFNYKLELPEQYVLPNGTFPFYEYNFRHEPCNATINATQGESGNIYSPGFHYSVNYPGAADCTTRITFPPQSQITFDFQYQALEDCDSYSNCSFDFVEISQESGRFNGSAGLALSNTVCNSLRFCGKYYPTDGQQRYTINTGDTASVRFHTDKTNNIYCGFLLQYKVDSLRMPNLAGKSLQSNSTRVHRLSLSRDNRWLAKSLRTPQPPSYDMLDENEDEEIRQPCANVCKVGLSHDTNCRSDQIQRPEGPYVTGYGTVITMRDLTLVNPGPRMSTQNPGTPSTEEDCGCATEAPTESTPSSAGHSTGGPSTAGTIATSGGTSRCPTTTTQLPQSLSQFLGGLAKEELNLSNVHSALSELNAAVQTALDRFDQTDIYAAAEILNHASNVSGIVRKDAILFSEIIDTSLNAKAARFSQASTELLLTSMESLARNVRLAPGESVQYHAGGNYATNIVSVDCRNSTVQIGMATMNDSATWEPKPVFSGDDHSPVQSAASAFIVVDRASFCPPSGVVDANRSKRDVAATTSKPAEEVEEDARISFQIYRTDKLFMNDEKIRTATSRDPDDVFRKINCCVKQAVPNSDVISATIVKRKHVAAGGLNVSVSFKRDETDFDMIRNFNFECGYWQNGSWITGNCTLVNQTGPLYMFTADHLTDFALLVSNNPKDPSFCDKGLKTLGTIGLLLSVIALSVVLTSLITIRLTTTSNKSILFLSICFNLTLLLLFFIFFLFADQQFLGTSDGFCSTIAAILYFLQLSMLIWTLSRAHMIYNKYVVVFDRGNSCGSHHFTFNKVWSFFAIGLPLIAVLTLYNVEDTIFLRKDFYCWLNPGKLVYATVVPFTITLCVSAVVSILVSKSIFRSRGLTAESAANRTRNGTDKPVSKFAGMGRKFWVLFVIQISLGMPWVFQYFTYIESGSMFFHYLFTISSAFQGVWIALIHFYERRRESSRLFRRLKIVAARKAKSMSTHSGSISPGFINTVTRKRFSNAASEFTFKMQRKRTVAPMSDGKCETFDLRPPTTNLAKALTLQKLEPLSLSDGELSHVTPGGELVLKLRMNSGSGDGPYETSTDVDDRRDSVEPPPEDPKPKSDTKDDNSDAC